MEPSDNFIRCEIAVAYTLLWAACLHNDEEEQQLSRLQAKAAHDVARTSLSRFSNERTDLLELLMELAEAILDWSVEKCAQRRIVPLGTTGAAGVTVGPTFLRPTRSVGE